MCGICGFSGPKNDDLLNRMCLVLAHRGPDQSGFYSGDGLSLGHRRLSIIDLSEHGRQPIANEDSTVWTVVNGEIYNFQQLRQELVLRGHIFRSNSDSETIVHAYEEYGEDFILRLDGMFALALWDERERRLILARDRIGIKPLYYAQNNSRLLFASEIKALLEDSNLKRELNREGFIQYLAFQCIITSETMFKGVHKLEPGSILIYKDGNLMKRRYWSFEDSYARQSTPGEVMGMLAAAVKSHLISDVPVGVLLSGGLDSSTIVALMHQHGIAPIETFTVGFHQPDDEFVFARRVAERFRTRHHELILEPERLEELLEKIVWHMDEPLADAGAIATYLAGEKVGEFVKVVLVGEGGDEALGGYNWHRLSCFPLSLMLSSAKRRLYFYLTTYYREDSKLPFEIFCSLFKDRKDFFATMAGFEIESILPNSLLMKVDKMTMAHSLEARVPFLDHAFVSCAASLPYREKVSLFSTKLLLRDALKGLLPQAVLKRRKHGFILPLHRWLKGELRDFARDSLLSVEAGVSALIPRHRIEALFEESKGLRSIENYSLLWKLLVFEVWQKRYLARP